MDVAGGVGSQTLLLAYVHPHLKYIVQDRAGMSAEMEEVCPENLSKHVETKVLY